MDELTTTPTVHFDKKNPKRYLKIRVSCATANDKVWENKIHNLNQFPFGFLVRFGLISH